MVGQPRFWQLTHHLPSFVSTEISLLWGPTLWFVYLRFLFFVFFQISNSACSFSFHYWFFVISSWICIPERWPFSACFVMLQTATLNFSIGSLQVPHCTCPPGGPNEFPSTCARIYPNVLWSTEHCSYLEDSEYSCMCNVAAKLLDFSSSSWPPVSYSLTLSPLIFGFILISQRYLFTVILPSFLGALYLV